MIYVDTFDMGYGRMKMSHMATDGDIEELHKMADAIGINRKWFQDDEHHLHPHYDVSMSKKKLAIELGAELVTPKQLITNCYPKLREMINTDMKTLKEAGMIP